MATRFYFPSAGEASVLTITPDADWEVLPSPVPHRPLPTSKTGTAVVTEEAVAVTAGSAKDILIAQYVSDTLTAQTISGTLTAVMAISESATSMNAWLRFIVRVIKPDGSVRGVLYNTVDAVTPVSTAGARNQEAANSSAATTINTRIYPTQTLSSVTASAGDRLVIELGGRQWNTTSNSYNFRVRPGDSLTSADYALTSGLTTSGVGWLELSGDVTFAPVVADPDVAYTSVSKRTFDFTGTTPGNAGALAFSLAHISGPSTVITETTEGVFDVEFDRPLLDLITLQVTVVETGGNTVNQTVTISTDASINYLYYNGSDWV